MQKLICQTAAELTASAVFNLFPNVLLVGGKATEQGFYYDFILEFELHDEGLKLIEEEIRRLIKADLEIQALESMKENGVERFVHFGQKFIAEKVARFPDNIVSLIKIGDFADFCPFACMTHTGQVKAFKLLAYTCSERVIEGGGSLQVTRIEGIASDDPKKLKRSVKTWESLKKKDHRALGEEFEYFTFVGKDIFWLPRGVALRDAILDAWKALCAMEGYQFVKTESFKHKELYNSTSRTFKDFPIKFAEWCECELEEEYEGEGGLFAQSQVLRDQLSLFCPESELLEEINSSLQLVEKSAKMLGFDCIFKLKGRITGSSKAEVEVEKMMEEALRKGVFDYQVCQSDPHGGVRIEALWKDALSREWKGAEITVDIRSRKKQTLFYKGEGGQKEYPFMVKISLIGSLERLIAILLEQEGGRLPFLLAPEQVRVVPVQSEHIRYAEEVAALGRNVGVRVAVDKSNDPFKERIRKAAELMIPQVLVVGDKEQNKRVVTARSEQKGEPLREMDPQAFFTELKETACNRNE